MDVELTEAELSLKTEIDNFYQQQGYHSNWSETERAFVCLNRGKVIGSVKVELIHSVTILRGMYVDSSFQRQGIGSRLLKLIEPVLNEKTAYCMPLTEAAEFYKQIGFREIAGCEYPAFLQQRCEKYRDAGYQIKTMIREQR
ncbi:GNAT family N-acetyltransferase [Vibrio sp. SCSIO 43137]|uniref:GNAT family N-acetyltransferase n=1 Tax=Vibrio sp. SCSIO 43137 TaxID=3021011 RepID=UPI002307E921|nr:GNAT family N-acetyltransferase [Vibrio sp. SCSIO 43137]WCE29341.1 GNAT family N-acetyltransferase [Vibrio sp. SCSIO 43137]